MHLIIITFASSGEPSLVRSSRCHIMITLPQCLVQHEAVSVLGTCCRSSSSMLH